MSQTLSMLTSRSLKKRRGTARRSSLIPRQPIRDANPTSISPMRVWMRAGRIGSRAGTGTRTGKVNLRATKNLAKRSRGEWGHARRRHAFRASRLGVMGWASGLRRLAHRRPQFVARAEFPMQQIANHRQTGACSRSPVFTFQVTAGRASDYRLLLGSLTDVCRHDLYL